MHHLLRTAGFLGLTLSAACHVGGSDAGDLGTFSLAQKRQVEQPTLPSDPPRREDGGASTPSQEADASPAASADAGKPARDTAISDAAISDAAISDAGHADAAQIDHARRSSWPMLGYDLGSTFNNSAETILSKQTAGQLQRKLVMEVGRAIYGAPLLVDDKLYYLDGQWVHALNVADGTLIWEALLGDDADQIATNTMSYDNGRIYIQIRNADVMAIDALDGKLIWHSLAEARYDRGYGSPTIADNLVLVGRAPAEADRVGGARFRGSLIAHDKIDGSIRWRVDTAAERESGVGIWSAPTVNLELGLVYVATGPSPSTPEPLAANGFMAVELATGALRFTRQLGLASDPAAHGSSGFEFGSSPVVFDLETQGRMRKLMAAGTRTGTVHVIDANSGEYIWMSELGPGSDDGDRGILANGAWSGKYLLFAVNKGTGSGNGATLYALEPATGKPAWSRELAADVLGRITVANGVGFVGAGPQLLVFDVEDGTLINTLPTDGPTAAGVAAIANGIVAFGTGASYLAHDDADQGKLYVYEVPQP
jgi:polyvinyl alcohol dehydrogenase (cytochrome)